MSLRYVVFAAVALAIATSTTTAFADAAPAATPQAPVASAAPPADPVAECKAALKNKKPDEPPTALGTFNGLLGGALMFDVTGGAFHIDAVTAAGDALYADADGKNVEQVKDAQGAPLFLNEQCESVAQASLKPRKNEIGVPFLVVILVLGAIFFTVFFRFINFRAFRHAVNVVRGKYDNPEDEGEISHFRALTSALSATVGLGNIAGVAVAITAGGPGAVVWMMLVAVFGMTAKFSSCTLAQLYRQVNPDGSISGGPMYYLDLGLKQKGPLWGMLGKVLSIMYAFMIMGGALGGGNMFQANQTTSALTYTFGWQVTNAEGNPGPSSTAAWVIGLIMAALVAAVILGGIKRIGAATSKIVPAMCGIYVVAALFVIVSNIGQLGDALGTMWTMAFSENAFLGGMMGVLVQGVKRAAFSNEAGLGSASIAHAAAKTDEPVREGMVAMLGPFIDTIVVCLMTSMVVIITGAWNNPEAAEAVGINPGVKLTAFAFESAISWFPYVLAVCIALFAYSTMISWCYYGERGWIYLVDHFGEGLGLKSVIGFRAIFVLFVVVGSVYGFSDVLDFSDLMVLSMAFPNIIGSVILAPKVAAKLNDYWGRYTAGEMKTYDAKA